MGGVHQGEFLAAAAAIEVTKQPGKALRFSVFGLCFPRFAAGCIGVARPN